MAGDLLIRRARAVRPAGVATADVRVRGGRIAEVATPSLPWHGEPVLDAAGRWLLPGLIDVHCDAIEREVQPRPNVDMPYEVALPEIDRKLALCGITTMYHGVSFGGGVGVRSNEGAAELVRTLARFASGRTLVRHQVHLRFEVSNWSALDLCAELVDEGSVGLLSLMDHTPGQGQFRDPARFRNYARKTFFAGDEEIEGIVAEMRAGRDRVREHDLLNLADAARRARVPVAGHDPDSPRAVELAISRGATLVEFPIELEVATYAMSSGVHVCVGAPNLLHGRSHSGNLSARDAIAAGGADVICSDYYPSGLLPAVWLLAHSGVRALPEALAMATTNAADAVGLSGIAGTIAPSLIADLLLVGEADGCPVVDMTIVGGEVVLEAARRGRPPVPRTEPVAAAPPMVGAHPY